MRSHATPLHSGVHIPSSQLSGVGVALAAQHGEGAQHAAPQPPQPIEVKGEQAGLGGGHRTVAITAAVAVAVAVAVAAGGMPEHHDELLQLLLDVSRVLTPRQHVPG